MLSGRKCFSIQWKKATQVFLFYPLLFSLALFFSTKAHAQADSTYARYGNENFIFFGDTHDTRAKDTVLDNVQNYFPRNLLGNAGLPNQQLVQDVQSEKLGLRYYRLPFVSDLFTVNDPLYFRAPLYTNIFASAGQKKEQALKLNHAQLINKKVNIALRFNRYSATGFYAKQLSFVNNLALSSHYFTKNGRWGYFAHLIHNKIKYQENGGVTTDTIIEKDVFANKQLYPVQLLSAKRNIKTFEALFTQLFRINNKSDSATRINHYLVYTPTYENNYYQYLDGAPMSGYYEHVFNDSVKTNDSTHLTKVSNALRYMLNDVKGNLMFYAGYKNEWSKLYRGTWIPQFSNGFAQAGAYWQNDKRLMKVSADAEYIFEGVNAGDYRVELWARNKFNFKRSELFASLSSEKRSPDQLALWNESNHFSWSKEFNKTQSNQLKVDYRITDWKLNLAVVYRNITGAQYYDTLALPAQLNSALNVTRFTIGKNLRLWRIHFNNVINYQLADDTTFIRIPHLITFHQLYYEGSHYKNNLQLQIGFQLNYYSKFTGNAYMPATNVFYVQNNESLGNYPFLDFFVNAWIKPVKLFVKVEHLNQGFSGSGYRLSPLYYQPDRAIKFGINWLLND